MSTGENDQALRKIIDLTRLLSIVILVFHFYFFCYQFFKVTGLANVIVDRITLSVANTGLFNSIWTSKLLAFVLLAISLVGARGKKDERINRRVVLQTLSTGFLLFFLSFLILWLMMNEFFVLTLYMVITGVGFLMILAGGTLFSRLIQQQLKKDIFNKENESFPQEERYMENEYSINLPTHYAYKGELRKGWINIINPFRGTLILGTPGAGKSYFVIRHVIDQHIRKGFSMYLYDFKFDDLSVIAYNALLKYVKNYKVVPKFYAVDFDTIRHRCNPLYPEMMLDISDANESSRTVMLGLNRDWIKKQGDFWVESAINFVSAIIWFLRKYDQGRYCTLPHAIELMQLDYKTMFPLLRSEPEVNVLMNPFENAYKHEVWETLESQLSSTKIGVARLSSPKLYYVLSGNDFTLDINNPKEPKIVCVGNSPQKQQIYGAVISLFSSRVFKLVNKKNQLKCSIIEDEFATQYGLGFDNLVATARSNLIATTIALQDYSQLKRDYGRDQAEVIMNLMGNIISGQVVGDTAKLLSERFGKIVQERDSVSINSNDTSTSKSTQLEAAVPPSKIAALSSGEFVGMVADDPLQKIELKVFHSEIINDHEGIKRDVDKYKPIPMVRNVTEKEIQENYERIKQDIQYIIQSVL